LHRVSDNPAAARSSNATFPLSIIGEKLLVAAVRGSSPEVDGRSIVLAKAAVADASRNALLVHVLFSIIILLR